MTILSWSSAFRLVTVVLLLVATGVTGQFWIGLVAAFLVGYWISKGGSSVMKRPDLGGREASVWMEIYEFGQRDIEVIRRLRQDVGFSAEEAELLLSSDPAELRNTPARFPYDSVGSAESSWRAVTALGATAVVVPSVR